MTVKRYFGILSISVAIFLMTGVSGTNAHLIGLGTWWFGVLLLVDSFLVGDRATRFLWGFGAAVAVWVFSAGWAVMAAEGTGQLVVAALSALLSLFTVARSVRSQEPLEVPSPTANSQLQTALSCWDVARNQLAMGQRLRAGLTYQDGLHHILWCINLARSAEEHTTALPPPDGLMPLYHAMGAMGREGVLVMDQVKATRPLRFHARMTLAAAHLADPTEGRPEMIKEALAAEAGSLPQLDLNGDGPLSAEVRIAGAAEARLLLARLMVERPGLNWEADRPWLVGSSGPMSFIQEQERFRQAVLPSCAGLTPAEEMRQLAQESLLMYMELCRAKRGYNSDRNRAKEILARSRA
jgi:hypothetical protein